MGDLLSMGTVVQDLRYAVRQLVKAPSFTVVAIVTLALGIGVNSAIFALADATWIRSLPFRDPDRLAMLWEQTPGSSPSVVAPYEFVAWSERSRTFEAMAAVAAAQRVLPGPDDVAEAITSQTVTARFFDVLGIKPIVGRTFLAADDRQDPDVVVIGEALWRSRFAADPAIVGQQLRLDGKPATVIGVVPSAVQLDIGFSTEPTGFWTLQDTAWLRTPGGCCSHYLRVIGRLASGVSLAAAQADMKRVAESVAEERPDTNRDSGVAVTSLRDAQFGPELRLTSLLLLAVVGVVLLMCSVNVANLQLARATARRRELAVRTALGASRARIVRQVLTENLLLGACGGLVGAGSGAAVLAAAPALIPARLLPVGVELAFDGHVLAFCAATALLVAVLFSLGPAWQAASVSPTQAIASESRIATGSGSALRSVFVAGEIAAAVLVLCGAGLFLRTLLALESVDPGYRAQNVWTAEINLPSSFSNTGSGATAYASAETRLAFYRDVEEQVQGLPGVRRVAWGMALPLDGWRLGMLFQIDGEPRLPEGRGQGTRYQVVSAGYFATLGIPILEGRSFTDRDRGDAVPVAIVNEAFVRHYLNGRDPLATRLVVRATTSGGGALPVRQVVGVVKQVKERPAEADGEPHVYVPLAQDASYGASLVVAAGGERAAALTPAIRAAVARVDREVPVTNVRTLADIDDEATSRPRFRALLVGTFGALALSLAVVGIFGVLLYSVQQRKREFGVRVALGAETRDVVRLVLTRAARITVIGAVIGLTASAFFSRWMAALLFGVQPLDLPTYAAAGLLLVVTVAIASVLPAVRAAHADPMEVLREE
jgi:putative ABC transport system permease protein